MKIFAESLYCHGVCLLFVVSCLPTCGAAESEYFSGNQAKADFLRLSAATTKDHTDRVETWTGRFEMKRSRVVDNPWFYIAAEENDAVGEIVDDHGPERRQLPGSYEESRTVEGEFVADISGDRLYSTYQAVGTTTFEQLHGGDIIEVSVDPEKGFHQASILTPLEYLHIDKTSRFTRIKDFPELPEPPGGFRMVEREPPSEGHRMSHQSTVFDPRRLLETGGRKLDFILGTIATWIETEQLNVEITVNGRNTFLVTYQYPNGERHTQTIIRYGGDLLLTGSKIESNLMGTFNNNWEYDVHDGIVIPVRHEYEHRGIDDELKNCRTVVLMDIELNREIADAEFHTSRLSADPLDRMYDRIDDKVELFVDSGTIVSAAEFDVEQLPAGVVAIDYTGGQGPTLQLAAPGQNTFRKSLILVNVALIIIAAFVLAFQKFRVVGRLQS